MRRAAAPLGVAVLLLVALSGCGDSEDGPGGSDDPYAPTAERSPSVGPDRAQATYGPIAEDVAAALATASGATTTDDGTTSYGRGEDDVCEFRSVELHLPGFFGDADPDGQDWDAVRSIVADTLADGWRIGDQLEIPGGYTGFNVTEESTGALLVVLAKTDSTVQVVAPVTGECDDLASESPLPDGR